MPAALALRPGPGLLPRRAQRRAPPAAATSPRSSRRYDRGGRRRCARRACQVLLFTVIERAGGTGRTAARLAARFARFNAGVRAAAARHRRAGRRRRLRCPALQDRRLWHEDRLHLAPAGHARVAAAVLETLGVTDPGSARRRARLVAGAAGARRPAGPAGRPASPTCAGCGATSRRGCVRRLRGRPAATGSSPKHLELVDVLPRERRVSRRLRRCAAGSIRSASTRVAASPSRSAGQPAARDRALHRPAGPAGVRRVEHQVVAGEQRPDRALGGVVGPLIGPMPCESVTATPWKPSVSRSSPCTTPLLIEPASRARWRRPRRARS